MLQHHILYHCGSGYCRKDPILIFVGVKTHRCNRQSENNKDVIQHQNQIVQNAVKFVFDVLNTMVSYDIKQKIDGLLSSTENTYSQESLSLDMNLIVNNGGRQFPWYIQPIEINDLDGDLKHGFLGGINWLTRTLTKMLDEKR